MKIYLNRAPIRGPWGGGARFINSFYELYQEKKIDDDIEMCHPSDSTATPDVILLAGLDNDGTGISADQAVLYKLSRPDVKIVLRVNENDARKNTSHMDHNLVTLSKHIDGTVFVSNWLRDYFAPNWQCKNSTVIHNGVDANLFKPNAVKHTEDPESFGYKKINLVTHHWSNNYLKGFDIYELIDEFVGIHRDDFTFTYIGRDRGTFKNTQYIRPMSAKPLGEELGKYDVYISASRFDPGPNHITESISCGLPTYVHSDGGGCVEFAGQDHAYYEWNGLEQLLLNKKFEPNQTTFTDWETCVKKYTQFLKDINNEAS